MFGCKMWVTVQNIFDIECLELMRHGTIFSNLKSEAAVQRSDHKGIGNYAKYPAVGYSATIHSHRQLILAATNCFTSRAKKKLQRSVKTNTSNLKIQRFH